MLALGLFDFSFSTFFPQVALNMKLIKGGNMKNIKTRAIAWLATAVYGTSMFPVGNVHAMSLDTRAVNLMVRVVNSYNLAAGAFNQKRFIGLRPVLHKMGVATQDIETVEFYLVSAERLPNIKMQSVNSAIIEIGSRKITFAGTGSENEILIDGKSFTYKKELNVAKNMDLVAQLLKEKQEVGFNPLELFIPSAKAMDTMTIAIIAVAAVLLFWIWNKNSSTSTSSSSSSTDSTFDEKAAMGARLRTLENKYYKATHTSSDS